MSGKHRKVCASLIMPRKRSWKSSASACLGFSVFLLALSGQGTQPELLRTEYLVEGDPPLRITEIMEGSGVRAGIVETYHLYSIGKRLLFYHYVRVNQKEAIRYETLVTGSRGEEIEFARGPEVKELSDQDREAGLGLVRIGGERIKVGPEDALNNTVQLRVQPLFQRWPEERRTALEQVYRTIVTCNLSISTGSLLPMLYPSVRKVPVGKCSVDAELAEPDDQRDRRFLLLEPALGSVFRQPIRLRRSL